MTNSNSSLSLSPSSLKKGWQIVKFGEIAKNISKRVNPSETDLEVYVGLEHLDPQSLRITGHGVPSDVKGQKLRIRPGQIIFGKRRAYQKKVAVADFDGICSAHAMVLEAIPGKIIPELLPFFMQSDMFMDRAVAISEGSLSPTIKWKTLAIQKFPLPPLGRQKKILEVLEKVEENISIAKDSLSKGNLLWESFMKELLIENPKNNGYKKKGLDVFKLTSGKSKTKVQLKEFSEDNSIPVYGGNGVNGYTALPLISNPVVIIGRVGEYCGNVQLVKNPCWVTDNALYTVNVSSEIDLEYLSVILKSMNLNQYKSRSGQPLITQGVIGNLEIIMPEKSFQKKIIHIYKIWKSAVKNLQTKIENLLAIRQKIISQGLELKRGVE